MQTEQFIQIPVDYKAEERTIDGRLVSFGYTYKLYLMIDGVEVVFEKDDGHQYRALVETPVAGKSLDSGLVNAVIEVLNSL
ncbi:MAG TPA: hypothetical protein VGN64_17490 [Dyadobacter sp.]|jgi:hypothetical protein|nr:hypothetical protein [Dyadobacter sp.]